MGDIDGAVPDNGAATETKTWAASWATFIAAFAGLTLLSSLDTDMVKQLPDWLETPAYALLASATTFLTAYYTKHKPGKLSLSALRAARASRPLH